MGIVGEAQLELSVEPVAPHDSSRKRVLTAHIGNLEQLLTLLLGDHVVQQHPLSPVQLFGVGDKRHIIEDEGAS